MVVKFADTQKEKDQKRIHQATTNLWGIGSMGLNTLTPQYLTVRCYSIIIGFCNLFARHFSVYIVRKWLQNLVIGGNWTGKSFY